MEPRAATTRMGASGGVLEAINSPAQKRLSSGAGADAATRAAARRRTPGSGRTTQRGGALRARHSGVDEPALALDVTKGDISRWVTRSRGDAPRRERASQPRDTRMQVKVHGERRRASNVLHELFCFRVERAQSRRRSVPRGDASEFARRRSPRCMSPSWSRRPPPCRSAARRLARARGRRARRGRARAARRRTLVVPRSRAAAGGGVLSAPRDGAAARALACAWARGRACGGRAAAAESGKFGAASGASGWPSQHAPAPPRSRSAGRARGEFETMELVASRRTGIVSGCAPSVTRRRTAAHAQVREPGGPTRADSGRTWRWKPYFSVIEPSRTVAPALQRVRSPCPRRFKFPRLATPGLSQRVGGRAPARHAGARPLTPAPSHRQLRQRRRLLGASCRARACRAAAPALQSLARLAAPDALVAAAAARRRATAPGAPTRTSRTRGARADHLARRRQHAAARRRARSRLGEPYGDEQLELGRVEHVAALRPESHRIHGAPRQPSFTSAIGACMPLPHHHHSP